jgi:hypothetical protein
MERLLRSVAARMSRFAAVLVGGLLLAACGQDPPPHDLRATEEVWCADEDGTVDHVTYQGHDGPLTAIDVRVLEFGYDITEDDLLEACRPRLRWFTTATLCGAYAPPDRLREFVERLDATAVHGEPGQDRPVLPVVLRGDVACEDVTLDVGIGADQLREWDAATTEALRRARQVEARLSHAADDGCLDVHEARDLAVGVRDELDGDWPVIETVRGAEDEVHDGLCFDVRLDRHGVIRVNYHAGPIFPPSE